VESELLFTALIGQHLPIAARAIDWSAFSLHGAADTALPAIAARACEGADTLRLQRGVAYGCRDGWLAPTLPAEGRVHEGTDAKAERAVFVAGAKDGALVGLCAPRPTTSSRSGVATVSAFCASRSAPPQVFGGSGRHRFSARLGTSPP